MAITGRPAKRAKLLDAMSSDSDASRDEGTQLPKGDPSGFKVNEDFAKRFEHNKKREEKQRLEEKYGASNGKRGREDEEDDGSEDESTDESEDDNADLVDLDVDKEIYDTLQALKSKDPRIYDPNSKFYRDWEADAAVGTEDGKAKKDKPVYLHDYHRQNLLAGYTGGEDDEMDDAPQTYQQEQDELKWTLVGSMHASAAKADNASSDNDNDDDEFMLPKSKPQHDTLPTVAAAAPPPKRITETDTAAADKDPETFLSNFMAARAWLAPAESTTAGPGFQPLDEDDSDDDLRADKFEEAWNLRFEDPAKANETLMSYQRDAGKYGVRRDELTGRKRAREREREGKEAEKRERDEERGRLRRLKIEEVEEKVRRIGEAAGKRIDLGEWREVIEEDFDDEEWDREMRTRFGEEYYAEQEGEAEGSEDDGVSGKKRKAKAKAKKPKWEDDIDIKDLVPDFKDDVEKPEFPLSDEEDKDEGGAPIPDTVDAEEDADDAEEAEEAGSAPKTKRKTKKDRQTAKTEAKRAARLRRRAIEDLVDRALPIAYPAIASASLSTKHTALNPPNGQAGGFRYRATSPTSFGLTPRDILFADDAALNSFVGLKKLHGFRDVEQKRRDKKRLGKKGRVREWRREVFGNREGPKERYLADGEGHEVEVGGVEGRRGKDGFEGERDVRDGERKEKRKRRGREKGGGKGGGGEA